MTRTARARGLGHRACGLGARARAAVTGGLLGLLVGQLVGMSACTEAGLRKIPPPPPPTLDNLLTIRGEFCTEPAEEVVFPVKILFLLDQSASLQCTDSENRRFGALNGVIQDLMNIPSVSFGFVGFSSWSREQTFTRNQGDIDQFLDPAGGLGPATDYQGALATAVRIIEQDMVAVGAAERARTKYVVILMSDGVPEPRCNAGCEDDRRACEDGEDNDGDGLADASDPDCANIDDNSLHPDSLYGVCNTTQVVPDDVYVDMDGLCPEYNQAPQILARISSLLALKDTYSAGDVRLHTVLLFSPQDVVEAICGPASVTFGYNHDVAKSLLTSMAAAGGGTFRDVNIQYENDKFLNFDFTSLDSPQWLVSFMADNRNAVQDGAWALDTDMDGLSDPAEAEAGTDPRSADSDFPDADGYTDLLEARLAGAGFDPLDPGLPAVACADPDDFDGDGLRNCEEDALGTDSRLPDTDGDGLVDWLELAAGTDPLRDDALEDMDFDGVSNFDEVRAGTDPVAADAAVFRTDRIRYGLDDLGLDRVPRQNGHLDERHCYEFSVEHIRLVTPLTQAHRGRNRIYLYTLEKPFQLAGAEERGHVACVEAYYDGEHFKDPADGLLDMRQGFWNQAALNLTGRVTDLRACAGAQAEDFGRDELLALSAQCLPKKVQLGDILYKRDDLERLVRRYANGGLAPRFARHPANVFHPIEEFDPDRDCVRPRELDLLDAYLERLVDVCDPCLHPAPEETVTATSGATEGAGS